MLILRLLSDPVPLSVPAASEATRRSVTRILVTRDVGLSIARDVGRGTEGEVSTQNEH